MNIMNTRKVKEVVSQIKEQWGCDKRPDYAFLINKKGKIYAINPAFSRILDKKIRIDTIGMYFGKIEQNGFRLSIEGSQIIGPHASKNVIELDSKEVEEWAKGMDVLKESDCYGYVILKHKNDFVGCGKISNGKIFNFIPKNRRLKEFNPDSQ